MTTKANALRKINVATDGFFGNQSHEFQLHRALTATLWVFNTHASNDLNYRMDIAPDTDGTNGDPIWDGDWLWQEKTASNPIVAGAAGESVDITEGWAMRGRVQIDDNSVHSTGTVTLAAVLANDTVTINGLVYTAVAGAKTDNTEFSIDGSDIVDATDLVDSINNDTRVGTIILTTDTFVAANSGTAIVTMTVVRGGTGGNSFTLISSNGTRLAVSGAGTFTGGTDLQSSYHAIVIISGTW